MTLSTSVLSRFELPTRGAYDLPTSPGRFADGGQYRIEIPSTEGPRAAIGLGILNRYAPEAVASPLPVPADLVTRSAV